jgi:PIN domain nuclease of toxin-antitoxin system
VTSGHAARVRRLPAHHRDPFDRLLVAQALCESARLLTVDRALAPYSDLVELGS